MKYIQLILLTVVFSLCAFVVFFRQIETSHGKKVLRVSHLFREPSADAALDAIAKAYTELHPDVTVEFSKVPRNIFLQWFRTQLISDAPPDIIQYDLWHRDLRQMVAQGFEPITTLVEQPNPYNQGTSLEGIPLRETYVDDLQSNEAFFPEMGAYFGLPYRGITLRVVYNRDLMKKITGDPDQTPANWREFIALCEMTEAYAQRNNLKLFPIAADKFGIYLMGNEASIAVSQKLALRTNYDRDFTMTTASLYPSLRFLRGEWSLRDPEILAGLNTYREIAHYMQPGFLQYDGSDVNFQFLQGYALMTIAAGPSLSNQATFPLGAFRIPGITRDNPRYGHYVLGHYSEAKHATTHAFGIPRKTKQKDLARDFLQFLTSQKINQQFTQSTDEVPVIRDVDATPLAHKFLPDVDGYIYGILPRALGNVSTRQLFSENLHRLFKDENGVEEFITILEEKNIMQSVVRDIGTLAQNYQNNLRETDAALVARFHQPDRSAESLEQPILSQTLFELDLMRMTYSLEKAKKRSAKPDIPAAHE